MGKYDYLKEVEDSIELKWDDDAEKRYILLDEATFEGIGDYTRSSPTGPSPGRIYKKNFGWAPNTPDNWWVYITERDPEDDEYVLHHPYKPVMHTKVGASP